MMSVDDCADDWVDECADDRVDDCVDGCPDDYVDEISGSRICRDLQPHSVHQLVSSINLFERTHEHINADINALTQSNTWTTQPSAHQHIKTSIPQIVSQAHQHASTPTQS
jgi:hypothetical protein